MIIEQYFLMTDYLLWEVLLNGDSPAPTRVIKGVLQPVAPTTVEQRLARKNELKARGTLLMALPDKHQLKFNTHKDANTLMREIEKRFGGNTETKKVQKTLLKQQYENFTGSSSESLDQIHDRLQKLISQLEILGVSLSQEDINLKFLRSLPSDWRTHTLIWRNKIDLEEQSLDDLFNTAAANVSAVSAKIPVSALPNVDSLSNVVIYSFFASQSNSPQLDNDALKQIDVDDLEEIDLKWQMAMLTVRARRFLQRIRRNLRENRLTSMGFDMSKLRDNALESLRQNLKKAEQERDDLKLKYQSGNRYHAVPPPYTRTFMPPKPDFVFNNAPNDVETDNPTFNVKLSPTKPDQDLSHTHRPSAPTKKDWVSDSDEESKTNTPQNVPSFVQSTKLVKSPRSSIQHVETFIPIATSKTAIPKPISNGKHRNRKVCFVCKSLDHLIKDCDYHEKKMAQTTPRNNAKRGTHKQYAHMTLPNPQRHVVPTAVLTQSKLVPITAVRPVTIVVPKTSVTRPRQAKSVVTMPNSPPRRHINRSPSPKASTFPPKVTAVKAPMVNAAQGNPQHALKDKGVIDSRFSRHMTRNMSYLFSFEELKGGYVAFGGNPKGGDYSRFTWVFFLATKDETGPIIKTFITGLENQLNLKAEAINTACYVQIKVLVIKPHNKTPYELLHDRTPSIGFMRPFGCHVTILNTLDSLGSGPTWLFDIDTLTKTMNYQPVTAGNLSNPSAGVQEQFDVEKAREESDQQYVLFPIWSTGSTNTQNTDRDVEPEFEGRKPESKVNVSLSSSAQSKKHDDKTKREAKGKIPPVGQLSPNRTNTFSVAGPLNAVASPTQGKSSCINTSQLLDDPNMLELEDITYSDNEDDVGAEADFNNLETSITVSLIPTTRVHKDHPVTQIIGDLSLATQTRSMTGVAKDQGGLSKINNDNFHTCMFACFLSQQEPKRVHQALKDPSWIEAMQEELLQFKMQQVWVLVDLPHGKRAIGTK
nr:hypothetical protein [Tanacetum cinerariifolium]